MSAKSIVDIKVNASEFEKFQALFADYSLQLSEQPETWKALNAAMGDAGTAAQDLANGFSSAKDALERAGVSAEALSVTLAKAVKAQQSLGIASHGTNKRMSELAKTAKGLASDISGMGKWVLRLGTGALAGLGFGTITGGLGIGALTNALYDRGRTAAGVGLSPGRYASFLSYAKPFLGEDALHAAAAAQLTYDSSQHLQMLGIDFNRARSMDQGILALEVLKGAVRNYQRDDARGLPQGNDPYVTAYHALGFGDLEDVRRAIGLGGVPALNAIESQYRRGSAALEYNMKPWADFENQLNAAGMQIEAVFGRELSPLIPEFKKLSIETVDAFASFAKSKEFREGIDDAKKGLEAFTGWLRGPDAKKLGENLGLVSDEVFAVAQKLKWLLPEPVVSPGKPPRPGMKWDKTWELWQDPKTGDVYDPTNKTWNTKGKWIVDALGSFWKNLTSGPIDPKILDAIAGQESGGNARIVNKTSGALGRYQFMPATADQYLGGDWTRKYGSTATAGGRANFLGSPVAQRHAALAYLADLEKVAIAKHFKGAELIKAVAEGWYGGTGSVGNPNVSGGPGYPTTGEYGMKVLERLIKALMLQQSNGMKVSITNSTAARVAISANATGLG